MCHHDDTSSSSGIGMSGSNDSIDEESTYAINMAKVRQVAKRRAMRKTRQYINSKRYLKPSRVSVKSWGILKKYPDIGTEIENFVKNRNIGADAWRRTGVLTFDGNNVVSSIKQKVTFKRIQEHLQSIYSTKFSYGTVVQLCVARNKRRRSAKNYRGAARVTSRRARKGFQLKYNPDSHWSAAVYKGLDFLQLKDNSNTLLVNRDDASGFRLDTMTTHHQFKTPVVDGNCPLTTHTDYINKYPSILQTTCYNFSKTDTSGELCAGVVKAQKLFPKNPAQHASDMEMLEKCPALQPAFINPLTLTSKMIDCIRVDGAGDEGPGHEEV